ncbi:isocitrate lyase/phosphoenolpyruvate mutase family protein [Streptomyces albus]|nr:isocitrate lyase/phosphoenolpyruvate mutase family protein [Streptomyces albus]
MDQGMDTTLRDALRDRAQAFHSLHVRQGGAPLALANAWDAASARLTEEAGAPAIATSSAGAAWALGFGDGDRLTPEEALALVARVVRAVRVPVTADIEGGYAEDPAGVARTVEGVLAAGAVGVNLEDARYEGAALLPVAEQAARIAAARAAADTAGVPLFLNARTDTYLRGIGAPEGRLAETLERAAAYVAAGADGIFVPGVTDLDTVARLAEGIPVPLNILVGPGAPSVAELGKAGAARVSLGSSVASAAYAVARRAAAELHAEGTYATLSEPVTYGEFNALFDR